MRTLLSLSLLALFAISACGGASGPAGKYSLDTSAVLEQMRKAPGYAQIPDEEKKKSEEMAGKMKCDLTLGEDGSFGVDMDMFGMKSQVKGTYKVEGDTITMTGKDVGSDQEQVKQGKLSGGTITMEMEPNAPPMVFRKN